MNALMLDATDPATSAQAVELLRQGKLIIVPSETVYGIAVNLHSAEARSRAKAIKQLSDKPGWVIHVAKPEDALTYVPNVSPLGRRLINKAWPGPIALQFATETGQSGDLHRILGDAAPETIIDGYITLRCPDNYATQEILAGVSAPVALLGATTVGAPPALQASSVSPAIGSQVDAIVDAGPTRYRKTSTLVRIVNNGYEILRSGIIDERTIQRMAGQLILFVCSGNTCRSPMAAALAGRLVADKLGIAPEELPLRNIAIQSAGVHAGYGAKATPEAVDVANEMKANLRADLSQPVTDELLRRADVIYTMTGAHRDEILDVMPAVGHKTYRLDPEADIDDPIGGDIEMYRQVAQRLKVLLEKRLVEWPI